ncbi:Sugar transporter SWEET1 [Phytophthora citrophthora]|uniref:Sugar transporter SWEET1 n=1 Tax=Phytophthora citrophthora TaxID=4793 RepID=A0AAD9GRF8_9STRA|nr:Sugar transporter SWEET1 [Phytophthora citrophthora]
MVDSTVLLVVRIFAAFGALALICSPSILMRQIHKQKNVGVASVLPLVTLVINSHVWMMYGYLAENYFPIFSCYVFGDLAALTYVGIYWKYTTERRYVGRVVAVTMVVFTLLSIYAIIAGLGYTGQTRGEAAKTIGFIGDFTAICLYASPMEKLFQVLKHKSAIFINVHMVMASLANNIMWFTYGLLMTNWIIIAPNILFVALNSSTLVLCIMFNPKTHPLHESFFADDDSIQVSVELSPKNDKVVNVPSPEYNAMQSPLEPLHFQLK